MTGPYGAGKPGDDQSMAPVDPVMTDDKYHKAVPVNLVMTDDHRFGHASTVVVTVPVELEHSNRGTHSTLIRTFTNIIPFPDSSNLSSVTTNGLAST